MWPALATGTLAMLLVAQTVQTRACPDQNRTTAPPAATTPPPTTPPAATPPPVPPGDTFTTQDGVMVRAETIARGLQIPWSIAFAPDGRLFVTERPGRVRIIDLATATSELALTVDGVYAQAEAGALGIALDPQFAQNRFVYLYHTATTPAGPVNRVVRYREAGGRLGERVLLLDNIPAANIHDGGRVRFGPDGLLYITTGDAANTSRSQDAASLAGKILRINADGTTPRSNPSGLPIFSIGHRNPQGLDWHPDTGDLWGAEHGAVGNDEINVLRAGVNYGWPRIEGAATMPGMEAPVTFYSPSVAPSGASFYRGTRFPAFANNLFVATLAGSHLKRLRVDTAARRVISEERLLVGTYGRLRDIVASPDGYLYLLTNDRRIESGPDDRIIRLVPGGG